MRRGKRACYACLAGIEVGSRVKLNDRGEEKCREIGKSGVEGELAQSCVRQLHAEGDEKVEKIKV